MIENKYLLFGLTCLAVILNLGILLLPSTLLGTSDLIFTDRRLALFLLIVSLWIISEASTSSKRNHTEVQSKTTSWLPILMSLAILTVFLVSLTEQALKGSKPFTILSILGGFSMVAGVCLRHFAIQALGAYFLDDVMLIKDQPLISRGIYQYLRHPSETGNIAIVFGASLLLGSTAGLLLCLFVIVPLVLIRIRKEDDLLMSHYAEEFAHYRTSVPALFPRIHF